MAKVLSNRFLGETRYHETNKSVNDVSCFYAGQQSRFERVVFNAYGYTIELIPKEI